VVVCHQVEPEQGQYNQTYMDLMKRMVEEAAKYGIYTLVDFHQVPPQARHPFKLRKAHLELSGHVPQRITAWSIQARPPPDCRPFLPRTRCRRSSAARACPFGRRSLRATCRSRCPSRPSPTRLMTAGCPRRKTAPSLTGVCDCVEEVWAYCIGGLE
jgi:hypothetical protein